jgi:hypothetical protein
MQHKLLTLALVGLLAAPVPGLAQAPSAPKCAAFFQVEFQKHEAKQRELLPPNVFEDGSVLFIWRDPQEKAVYGLVFATPGVNGAELQKDGWKPKGQCLSDGGIPIQVFERKVKMQFKTA